MQGFLADRPLNFRPTRTPRSELSRLRRLSLVSASDHFHVLQNVNDFRGEEVGQPLTLMGGGSFLPLFLICSPLAVICPPAPC